MGRRTKANTLRASWDRAENEIAFGWPEGVGVKPDAHMLYGIFAYQRVYEGRTLFDELERRGYDVSSLLFSVKKDPAHPRWASQQPSDGQEKKR